MELQGQVLLFAVLIKMELQGQVLLFAVLIKD
jgi:hypothetical protein